MRIFQDVFTEDEIISDSYKFEELFNGVVIAVKSRQIVKGEDNVDVGCGNAFGGKNEDEEEGGAGQENVQKVIDLVDSFQYQETSFDQEGYLAYFKGYAKKVLDYLTSNKPDRVADFKTGAVAFRKFVVEKFSEFTFYTPKSYDADNSIILSYYKNDEDEAPTFLYVLDGLKSYKV